MSRITYANKEYYEEKFRTLTDDLDDYVINRLNYEGGGNDLSRAEGDAQLTKEALGRLVQILVEKGVLDVADVLRIAPTRSDEKDHKLL